MMLKSINKKAQTGGLITGIIMGIAGLVIGTIIALIIVGTLRDAGLVTGLEQGAIANMSANFTSGIDQVSSKLPTVLLIAAIVLILAILVFLVAAWKRMSLTGGGI